MKTLRHFALALPVLLMILLAIAIGSSPASASPAEPQAVFTPTADADGRILYIVQPNDTCLSVALRFLNGDVNRLRELNMLDEACTLRENQKLLIGTYAEPTVTPGPSPTPTLALPTPTPFDGNGEICIFLFNDINGNALAEDFELAIFGGAVSISDTKGEVSLTGETEDGGDTGYEPVCFPDLPENEYNISVGPPEGYNPTTVMNFTLKLTAGDRSVIDFGAQPSSFGQPVPVSEGGRSPVMAVIGVFLLLGGILLGVYFLFLRRDKEPPQQY